MNILTRAQQNTQLRSSEAGFTIVEVLVSLLIFSIAIVGVITVAAQGGLNVNHAKLSLTATYLADEGIELMRAMRDTSVVGAPTTAIGWSSFTGTFGSSLCAAPVGGSPGSPCDIDPTIISTPFPSALNVVSCTVGGFCPLYYLPNGTYTSVAPGTGATPSAYSRQVTVAPIGTSGDEVVVTVKVRYREGVSTKMITQTENLYNWY